MRIATSRPALPWVSGLTHSPGPPPPSRSAPASARSAAKALKAAVGSPAKTWEGAGWRGEEIGRGRVSVMRRDVGGRTWKVKGGR